MIQIQHYKQKDDESA